ncbi:virulence factor Mce family protein [Mycobacterium sp. 663a-19]|uniref:virulence factor Mce family protein n=1 Tax=Mycobacterium sp. 663a-19 TaxID=2986148 RepID=UPI002D1E5D39|nr:virulence factor Mce family protein [Mycobacterium sp. 663a-19]MEB3980122.1 virulence factor Mce family protein [Mycobacterium sp. 663a-19]
MRDNLGAATWRFAIFVIVCGLATFGLFMIFAQLRFQSEVTYNAEFTNVSGLKQGDLVRIAGVEVGKVKHISIRPDTVVAVEFSADNTVTLTEGTRAVIRYDNVIGNRYMELQEGAGGVKRLSRGQTIPTGQTEPALDLDALIGGFRPLFRALDPLQVNALTGQLIQAFQGQGEAIGSFLAQTAALTSTLANRDELIGQVIVNLNTVLGSLGNQSQQFDKALTSLAELVKRLAAGKTDLANSLAYSNAAAGSIADLLSQARPPFKSVVTQSERANDIVLADHDYFDDLLNTLPDAYQALARQGMYGDFFTFYLCEAVLKVNGKGGQPVYVRLANQPSGRCTPK